jgi:DNA mismatch repair ATPase MutL
MAETLFAVTIATATEEKSQEETTEERSQEETTEEKNQEETTEERSQEEMYTAKVLHQEGMNTNLMIVGTTEESSQEETTLLLQEETNLLQEEKSQEETTLLLQEETNFLPPEETTGTQETDQETAAESLQVLSKVIGKLFIPSLPNLIGPVKALLIQMKFWNKSSKQQLKFILPQELRLVGMITKGIWPSKKLSVSIGSSK